MTGRMTCRVASLVSIVTLSVMATAGVAHTGVASADKDPDCHGVHDGREMPYCAHAQQLMRQLTPWVPGETGLREADADTDVTHYILDIEIIPEYDGLVVSAVRVEGTSTIQVLPAVDNLDEFTVDLRSNLSVNSVTGDVASWSRVAHTIVITLDRAYSTGETFEVVVDYEGYPDASGFAAFKWWTRNGNLVVGTLSEPFYARYWWPCKDALNDKATMETSIIVPDPMIAASNGLEVGSESLSGDRTRYDWEETYPMIPYLASLAITNYERYDLVYTYESEGVRDTMPVPCFLYPDHWDFDAGEPQPSYKAGCDELITMLDVFSARFGTYPFIEEKYGVAETGGSGGIGASMEHQTISSMSRVSDYSDIMAHELAHQWWGDEITCETWYDIWLNEGFASYSESLYREFKPDGGISSYWSRVDARRPTNPDARVYRTSISSTSAIFSSNDVYRKGSWVLHMLRHVMGSEAFFAAIDAYRAEYQHDSATTAEFAQTISESFGHDLNWFVDQWVMMPGSPDYEWNYTVEEIDGQTYLKLAIWQKQNLDGYDLIVMPVDMRVSTASGSIVHKVWNDDWTEYYVIPIAALPTNVEFDEDSGASDQNWILFDSRTRVGTPVEPPPVLLGIEVEPFAGSGDETVVTVRLSEEIGSLDAADVSLAPVFGNGIEPTGITYDAATYTATVWYEQLDIGDYVFTVFDENVTANGKWLDGETDTLTWWDDQRFPSGDGQPGGDALFSFSREYGDHNGDGTVDLDDFIELPACMTGPNAGPFGSGCGAFDFDADDDVDMEDVSGFTQAMR